MAAQRTPGSRPRAVLLDALGTLVRLEPPAPRLRAALREHLGVDVPEPDAGLAVRREIGFYRANLHRGRDAAGLAGLRRDCARVVADALGLAAPLDRVEAALLAALEFRPYEEVPGVLEALRARDVRLVVLSNWDVSLHEVLERTALRPLLDGAVASAELGAAKPDPGVFAHALSLVGTDPGDAWHVGDSLEADVAGALAAGLRPVLLARPGEPDPGRPPDGVPVIDSLAELPALCA